MQYVAKFGVYNGGRAGKGRIKEEKKAEKKEADAVWLWKRHRYGNYL